MGIVTKDWLIHIKKILEALAIPINRHMVRLVIYTLTCETEHCWMNVKRSRNITMICWVEFTNLFFERYFPPVERVKMINKFKFLKLEDMTVDDYSAKFNF